MTVFLDDEPAALDGDTLATLLASAQEKLEMDGRVVVEVRVGDRTLVGDDLAQDAAKPLGDEEVRLYSADPRTLAGDTLRHVRDRLEQARDTQQQAAQHLQRDEAGDGLTRLGELVAVWQQTQQAVVFSAGLVGIPLDELDVDGQSVVDLANELLEQLRSLKEHVTHPDTVALADALAYEWPAVLEKWHSLVSLLIERIESERD